MVTVNLSVHYKDFQATGPNDLLPRSHEGHEGQQRKGIVQRQENRTQFHFDFPAFASSRLRVSFFFCVQALIIFVLRVLRALRGDIFPRSGCTVAIRLLFSLRLARRYSAAILPHGWSPF